MTRHATVTLHRDGMSAEVDMGIAELISNLWQLGIPTLECCQDSETFRRDGLGHCYIVFPLAALDAFVNALTARSLYHPDVIRDTVVGGDGPQDEWIDTILDRMFDMDYEQTAWPHMRIDVFDAGWKPGVAVRLSALVLIPVDELTNVEERIAATLAEVGPRPWVTAGRWEA